MAIEIIGTSRTRAKLSGLGRTHWALNTERGISTASSEFFDSHPELLRMLRGFDPHHRPRYGLHTVARGWFRVELGPAAGDSLTAELAVTIIRSPHGITARELDVLTLIADGDTNNEVAAALDVSPSTVRSHVERLLTKLGVTRRSALAALAVEHGLRRLSATPTSAPAFAGHLAMRRPFVVGAVAPAGATGQDLRRGGELAVELLNRRGGVRDRPVELRWRTSGSAEDAIDALDGWAWGAVDAITYFHSLGSPESFLEAAAATDIPVLHNTHGALVDQRRNSLFRVCPGIDVYGAAFISFVRDGIRQHRIPGGDGRVVVIGEDPSAVGPVVAGRGGPITGIDTLEVHGAGAWRSAAASLRNDPPSAILLASFDAVSIDSFLLEFERIPFPSLLFGLWVPGTPELLRPPPEGFVWASNSGRPRDPISVVFEQEFVASHGTAPWLTAGIQFDMIGVAAQAWAGASRPDDPASVAEEMRRQVYRGVNGGYYFGGAEQDCLSFPSQVSDASLGHPRLVYQQIAGASRRIGPTGFADRKMRTPTWLAAS